MVANKNIKKKIIKYRMTKRSAELKGLDDPPKRARLEEHKCVEDIKIIVGDEHFHVCECSIKHNRKPSPVLLHALSLSKEIEFKDTTILAVKRLLGKEYTFNCRDLNEKIDLYILGHRYDCQRAMDTASSDRCYEVAGSQINRLQKPYDGLLNIVFDHLDEVKDWENISPEICRKLISHCKTFPTFVKCFLRCGEFTDEELMTLAKQHSPVKKKRTRLLGYFGGPTEHKDEVLGMPIDEKIIPYDNKSICKYLAYRLEIQIESTPQEYICQQS